MSGIAAIVHFDGRPVADGQIEKMTGRMSQRGPDGIRHWQEGQAALGHCALHTTYEATLAAMPLEDDSGQVILTMDGRVDNYSELRRRLLESGIQLRSAADAELVLQAYLTYGKSCQEMLEGDFAIVIWDRRHREILCLRDHFGHKAFHYHWNGKTLAIATDVLALLSLPWVNAEIDIGTIAEFLSEDFVSQKTTFWKDIKRLPPAGQLIGSERGIQQQRYWAPEISEIYVDRSRQELAEEYLTLIHDAVRRRSRSHLPLAAEVSGGLDSSAIYALAVQGENQRDVLGYTLRYEGDPLANDLPYARAMGCHLNQKIEEVTPTTRTPDWYQQEVQRTGEFAGYPNGIMHDGILKAASSAGCRVLLDGTGGDEWLTGDPQLDYFDAVSRRRWRALGRVFNADARDFGSGHAAACLFRHGVVSNLPGPILNALKKARTTIHGFAKTSPNVLSETLLTALETLREDEAPDWPALPRQGQMIFLRNLRDAYRPRVFEMGDRQAARYQMERRSPFDDLALLKFTLALPLWSLRNGRTTKAIHREAMRGILPEPVRCRKDKARFLTAMEPGLEKVVSNLADDPFGWLSPYGSQDIRKGLTQETDPFSNLPWVAWAGWQISAIAGKKA